MWGAITKDFGEFVSTVATDATETLQTIDQTLDEPMVRGRDDGTNTGGGGKTTARESLIDPDTGIPIGAVPGGDGYDGDGDGDGQRERDAAATPTAAFSWKPPSEASGDEARERLIACPDVFCDPLLPPAGDEETKPAEREAAAANNDDGDDKDRDNDGVPAATATKADKGERISGTGDPDPSGDPIAETTGGASASRPRAPPQPSAASIRAFLETFDVGTETERISELLASDPALKTTFSALADRVSYSDFWTRYFYRIDDPLRLAETYSSYYEKHLAETREAEERRSRSEREQQGAMGGGIQGLSSFLGGVVTRLTTDEPSDCERTTSAGSGNGSTDGNGNGGYETNENDNDNDTSGFLSEASEAGPATMTALGFLSSVAGRGGRPPFVMNTAVSDDDDENETEESDPGEEESEVELGWDDDDDDNYDDDDDETNGANGVVAFRDGDDRSETVDFKDAEKEGLLEELEQARAERDALQTTVEMQAKELKNLSLLSSSSPSESTAPAATRPNQKQRFDTGGNEDAATSLRNLKMELFEKDAELAALRAGLEDRHETETETDGTENDGLRAELEALKAVLAEKDAALAEALGTRNGDGSNPLPGGGGDKSHEVLRLEEALSARDAELSALRTDLQTRTNDALGEAGTEHDRIVREIRSRHEAEKEAVRAGLGAELEDLRASLAAAASARAEAEREHGARLGELVAEHAAETTALRERIAPSEAPAGAATPGDAGEPTARLRGLAEERAAPGAAPASAAAARAESERSETGPGELVSPSPGLPASPGSSSTGVRVGIPSDDDDDVPKVLSTPVTPAVSPGLEPGDEDHTNDNNDNDDDDDDGWGDDW